MLMNYPSLANKNHRKNELDRIMNMKTAEGSMNTSRGELAHE